ncbi:hypothetical protein E8E13_003013 [Curvularia kusanoi]|uniref:Uncharacterized protein n=1 Tax=Curvularia kusanoi TaxID=90978 RepID=A0A9P4W747_CURKU|nr:hypothetical protein E8E13_003013 [Curvularia kusanoi]
MFATTSTRPFTLHLPLRPSSPSQTPSPPQSPQSPLPLPEFPSPSATAYKPHLAAGYVAGNGSTFADGLKTQNGLKAQDNNNNENGEKNEDGVNTWPFECAAATRGFSVGAAMLLPDTDLEGGIALSPGLVGLVSGASMEEELLGTTNNNKREDTAAEAYARAQADHMTKLIASYIAQNGDVLQPHA